MKVDLELRGFKNKYNYVEQTISKGMHIVFDLFGINHVKLK